MRTCLKQVLLHPICLARARTCCGLRPGFRQKKVESWSKACRKPARTCRKPGCKPGQKPGLQLARIMECGLKFAKICGIKQHKNKKQQSDN